MTSKSWQCTLLVFLLAGFLSGCAAYDRGMRDFTVSQWTAFCSKSPKLLAYEEDRYCIEWSSGEDLIKVGFDNISPAPVQIPEEVIAYGLKSFVGFTGEEEGFDNIVSSLARGLKRSGLVVLMAKKPKAIFIRVFYQSEQKHLLFQDSISNLHKVYGAIDLSDVDVTVKPEAPEDAMQEEGSRMSAELRELKKLMDDGILTEDEFQEQKRKILERY